MDGDRANPVAAAVQLCSALEGFEPDLLSGTDCAVIAEHLARAEKACAAGAARAGARAAACGAHRSRGVGDAKEWLARVRGSSAGQARAALGTAAALDDCPATRQAVIAGELSLAEGAEIVKTEAQCPGSETELLGLAKASSLGVLKERARRRRLKATDVDELHRRQHAAREVRHWRDDLGMVHMNLAFAPEVGIPIVNRLEAETKRIHEVARREGSDEAWAAHAADALAKMLTGKGKGKATSAELIVVWRRPAADEHNEGTAHIVGGGPIPVSLARKLAEQSFVKAVMHDGVRIETVKHVGRYIPTELRTALALGDPPDFEGFACTDCGGTHAIERDHIDPVANGGLTAYDNVTGRCWGCHDEKTEQDRQAGLLDGKGRGRGREPPESEDGSEGNPPPRAA